MLQIVLVPLLVSNSIASMSETFLSWVSQNYGSAIAERLNRTDLGPGGSFGGGNHTAKEKTSHEPIIIVHGMTSRVDRFSDIRNYFLSKGYNDEEIYGTTYGDAGRTSMLRVTMECDFVKRIRELIIAVNAYTNSQVDVLGFSMGSPIARKAIMGGACVDTNEQLGAPLTSLVDTYVGIAGANYGSFLCFLPLGSCNTVNGLHCNSQFLADINAKPRYEGSFIFTIYSTDDEYVGYEACGRIASAIDGQNKAIEESDLFHEETLKTTVATQFNLVTSHKE
uniref:Lipase domain-containing protein n=1 Tax=Ascaris lumbricoides TaxID=6252 RepID=A0A0M3I5N2_ASCLU